MSKKPKDNPRAVIVLQLIGGGPARLSDFQVDNDLVLVVTETGAVPTQYVAQFDCAVALYANMLVPVAGQGNTPAEAVADYRRKIKGHTLVIDPGSAFRREVQCPSVFVDDMN